MQPPSTQAPSAQSIVVDAQTIFLEDESSPSTSAATVDPRSVPRYVFAYTITISNHGDLPAQLISRHWIITDGKGKTQEVRGDGVVGQQPRLAPGESFRYTSAAIIETPVGTMHGSYQMKTDDGDNFDAPIEPFGLAVPGSLN